MNKLAMLGVLLTAVVASRANGDPGWRIDAAGGAIVGAGKVKVSEGGDSGQFDIVPGGSFAVGGGYGLGNWVDLTTHFQSSFTGFDVIASQSLDVYSLTAGGRVYLLPPGRVRPWLASELGWYRADGEVGGLFLPTIHQSDDSFGLNAGGGVDVNVNRRVSLGVDVRYHDAFDALNGLQFVTTMFNVGIHLGGGDRGL